MYDKGTVFDKFQFWLTIKNKIFKILTYLSITMYKTICPISTLLLILGFFNLQDQ